jgi:hypothetical protein
MQHVPCSGGDPYEVAGTVLQKLLPTPSTPMNPIEADAQVNLIVEVCNSHAVYPLAPVPNEVPWPSESSLSSLAQVLAEHRGVRNNPGIGGQASPENREMASA